MIRFNAPNMVSKLRARSYRAPRVNMGCAGAGDETQETWDEVPKWGDVIGAWEGQGGRSSMVYGGRNGPVGDINIGFDGESVDPHEYHKSRMQRRNWV